MRHPAASATAPSATAPRAGLWASAAPALAFAGDAIGTATDQVVGLAPVASVLVVAVVTAGCSLRVGLPTALWVSVMGWLFVIGFAFNSYGELHVAGATEWLSLVALVLVGAAASRVRAR